jgi:isopenicillin-N N-acyltransferase-like protein
MHTSARCLVALVATAVLVLVASPASAAWPARCLNGSNENQIYTAPPTFLRSVANGKLYRAGNTSAASQDWFYVQHLWGTPYEMGVAHGQLHAAAIPVGIASIYRWLDQQAAAKLPWLCGSGSTFAALCQEIVDVGAFVALQAVWQRTAPYAPPFVAQELQGIADGTCSGPGASSGACNATDVLLQLQAVNSLPALIKMQCSAIGATRAATVSSGGFAQMLRSLDGEGGDTMPLKELAAVTVYHDSTPGVNVVANFAWIGFAGSVTGLAADPATNFATGFFLGEKAWDSGAAFYLPDGEETSFMYRRILRTSKTVADGQQIIKTSRRTSSVHTSLGTYAVVPQLVENTTDFTVVLSAGGVSGFNIRPDTYDYPQHPVIADTVYIDKESQPTKWYCFADCLQRYHGNITAEILARKVAARLGTGDLHIMTFDARLNVAYFANARKHGAIGPLKAVHRQFTALRMLPLWLEKPPQ